MAVKKAMSKGPRYVNGFDLETPYVTSTQRQAWHRFLRTLTPRSACRLCGIDHLPHWLASGPNWRYLAEYLEKRFPGTMTVRQALIRAIKERRPDPQSEKSPWWRAMKHLVPELERFALLANAGRLRPMYEVIIKDDEAESDEEVKVIVIPGKELEAA